MTSPLARNPGRARPLRRFFIETWGCQMNDLDSQRLAGQLVRQGLRPAADPQSADLVLLNSCSVREKAEQKAYSRLGEYKLLKNDDPGLVIGFCGCVAQQEGERALQRAPELDFVLGTGRVGEITRVVEAARRGRRIVATGFPEESRYDIDAISRDASHKGMVTVIEGCNKRCTFCVVPQTRGPERSRPLPHILAEVKDLVGRGFEEIELLGQTVNHWQGRGEDGRPVDFADLLDAVASEPGVRRLRFVTSYPRDFTGRMIEQVGRHDNICPYLHLPVQSGSDAVLRRMGRGYTVAEYRALVGELREARRDLALSTDIIVAFPGETESDFEETLALLAQIRFASVFAFKYSPRPGTAALRLEGNVGLEVADHRLQALFRLQNRIQLELNQELVGRDMEVLVTGHGKQPGSLVCRTGCHRVVHLPAGSQVAAGAESAARPGGILSVRIARAFPHSLLAAPIDTPHQRRGPPPGRGRQGRRRLPVLTDDHHPGQGRAPVLAGAAAPPLDLEAVRPGE